MTDICDLKSSKEFYCKCCDYKTSRKSQYDRHLLTPKHQNTDKSLQNTDTDGSKSSGLHECKCGKTYKHRQSLFTHSKKCNPSLEKDKEVDQDSPLTQSIVVELIKQNQSIMMENKEFKDLIIEQNKQLFALAKKPSSITNNNNTNINNKNTMNNHFNINLFLNETCKDAMNLTDFVDSLQLTLKDLENTGKLGYEESISQIFIKGLKQLDFSKRPIHCTDTKRERLYVRDKDVWEKDQEKEQVRKAVRKIANKNVNQIVDWIEANPDSQDYHSKKNDQYLNIVLKSTGGSTKEEEEKRINKVISSIAKHVEIDKSICTDDADV
jgi:hypothetical protein